METMQSVIEEILGRLNTSARGLDRAASKQGYSLAYTTISAIRNGTHSGQYQTRTLDAIAGVGGIGRDVVYRAAGLPLPGKPFADELPDDVDYLDRASREAVKGVIRVLLEQRSPTRSPLSRDDVGWIEQDDYDVAAKTAGRAIGSDPDDGYDGGA